MDTEEQIHITSQKNSFKRITSFAFSSHKRKAVFFLTILLLVVFYFSLIHPPAYFPVGKIITVEKGAILRNIAKKLKSEGVIRSTFLFRAGVIIFGGEKSAHAGEYNLNNKEGVFTIAYRIVYGKFGLTSITIQVPEGLNVEELALHLSNSIEMFDMTKFLSLAKKDEGYLFPDTYYFLPNVSEREVYETMKETFNLRLEEIGGEITKFVESSGRSVKDIVVMASIIELEASDFETKRNISGVLWNRMDINMPLQVDAAFVYLLGKGTLQLSLEDLQIDSPYNTYINTGLPPGPIANPGLSSLLAAVTPIENSYFYYLADRDGVTHFSKTFEEHSMKKAKYID